MRRAGSPRSRAVSVSEANIHSAEADVTTAEQGVSRTQAEWAAVPQDRELGSVIGPGNPQ